MKKLLMLSAAALFIAPAAFAEEAVHDSTPHKSSEHAGDMMKKIDTDGDGTISKEEFMGFHEARFKEMDTNADGKVTKDESEAKRAEWREKMKKFREERKAEMEKNRKEKPESAKPKKEVKKDPVKAPAEDKPVATEAPATEAPVEAPAETPAH